jgi:hypothetical protein
MELLTPDEILIVRVARATCFGYRFESGGVPDEDVHQYVDELIALYRRKPKSLLAEASAANESETLESSLEFCAQQLADTAPEQASKLRSALKNSGSR